MSDWGAKRPTTWGECQGRPMPCPWVGCKYHTLLDVGEVGSIIINSGMELAERTDDRRRRRTKQKSRRLPVWRQAARKADDDRRCDEIVDLLEKSERTCLLAMVGGQRSYTLEETGKILNVSRERVRQVELVAFEKMREHGTLGLTAVDLEDPS